ncbi:MAG: hypothetical protein WAT70_03785 [Rhizobiaceae bacterium]
MLIGMVTERTRCAFAFAANPRLIGIVTERERCATAAAVWPSVIAIVADRTRCAFASAANPMLIAMVDDRTRCAFAAAANPRLMLMETERVYSVGPPPPAATGPLASGSFARASNPSMALPRYDIDEAGTAITTSAASRASAATATAAAPATVTTATACYDTARVAAVASRSEKPKIGVVKICLAVQSRTTGPRCLRYGWHDHSRRLWSRTSAADSHGIT